MKKEYTKNNVRLICADNKKIIAKYPDNYFDLACIDPEYGINIDNNKKGNFVMTKHKSKGWDKKTPDTRFFKELFRISKNQIIFGGNYFNLPPRKGWICWDKINPLVGKFSDFELAWTSFVNHDRMYRQAWIGYGRTFIEKSSSIHPTQKPLRLYDWIYLNFCEKEWKIIDTNFGSASSAISAYYFGFSEYVGIEIDEQYFDEAVKRFENQTAQQRINFNDQLTKNQ
jgi:site-specific DNA-methyltransferase (adenine-specific)